MKTTEMQERRRNAPNVKMVSKGVLVQFLAWFRAGIGLGLTLFVALITLSALCHGANWITDSAKQGQLRGLEQGRSPVLPKVAYAAPVRVVRSPVVVQQNGDAYRLFREQARFVTDLSDNVSRTVSRFAR